MGRVHALPFFTDHQDPALAEAVRKGRREEFSAFEVRGEIPDPQSPGAFARSKLNWTEARQGRHASLLDWHRRLIHARRTLPDLAAGPAPGVTCNEGDGWLVVDRGSLRLAVNLGSERVRVPLMDAGALHVELASSADVAMEPDAVSLPPMSAALLAP